MNGPTRPGSFKSERPVGGARKNSAADIFEELDQFVDSEPVGWSERRSDRGQAVPSGEFLRGTADDDGIVEPYADPEPRTGGPVAPVPDSAAADVAFSRASASGRREAFQARLKAELSRPAEPPEPAPPPKVEAPAPRVAPRGEGPRKPETSQRETEWSTPLPAAERTPPSPVWTEDDAAEDENDDPVQSGVVEEPVDALDWELDNAIGAIIASSTGGNAPADPAAPIAMPAPQSPDAPAPRAAADPSAAKAADGPRAGAVPQPRNIPLEEAAEPDPGPDPFSSKAGATMPRMEQPVRPVAAPGRGKPIPTFRFDRRTDTEEHAVAAAPDLDNPLSSIFFQNYRADPPADDSEVGSADLLADIDADGMGDEFADFDGEVDDRLPPSLIREAEAPRRRRPGLAGIGAAIGALAVLGGAVVIGLNVFAGDGRVGGGGEPPLIRADAVDVKVRPAEDNTPEPEPDIAERAEIGETDSLVIPDEVEIGGFDDTAGPGPEEDTADILSRRVRTVTVRPDGTIVRGGEAEALADEAPADAFASDADILETMPEESDVAEFDVASVENSSDPIGALTEAPIDREEPLDDPETLDTPETPEFETLDNADLPPGVVPVTALPAPRPAPPARSRTVASTGSGPVDLAGQRAAEPAAPAAPQQPAVVSDPSAPWGVQVSSQRTEADAQTSYRNLQQRYPSILGSVQPIIMPADLPGRGRFFRVRLAANSRGEAAALCQRLKSAGADCFIGRN